MSLIGKVQLPPLWRSKVKKAKAPAEANGAKPPAVAPFKAGASPLPGAPSAAKVDAKEEPKQAEGAPRLKPWVKPGAQGQAASGPAASTAAAPVPAPKEPAPVAAATPAAQAPGAAATPPAGDSGLKDDLKSLFTEDEVGNEELRKLAEGLKELDINELARDCRELVALLKGKVAQN